MKCLDSWFYKGYFIWYYPGGYIVEDTNGKFIPTLKKAKRAINVKLRREKKHKKNYSSFLKK
ncbi:hypothetical protein EDM57_05005 [Brevibacillus gelatini]|uniref:Uncharacterized protein n=1 Tax=Brevibacillus gelatini TaxID=1655277 RepID=A0A3M8B7S4_9BACL|nr:hypothetical protein EDM57_05005 [Brevibacillus gelatini]